MIECTPLSARIRTNYDSWMPKAPDQPSLLDAPRAGANAPEFTVSEISNLVRRTVEDSFAHVRVRGEISECKVHSSGHVYITLKEGTAILAAVCWRGQAGKLGIKPAIGMEVVCTGRLTTYAGQSKYQLVIEGMSLAGIGALLKMLEERKKKLAAEGLFDASRKRALPYLPEVIGVVTSPTGAVIRDILHRLDERFPRRVFVWPVAVQGEGAAEQVASAIHGFNALTATGSLKRPDLLIVARGGGSVEDLMPFNEEIVVRAVAESKIPVITAVGHETDTTLVDYAADLRAPTPTAAAEKAVPVRAELLAQVLEKGTRLFNAIRRATQDRMERLHLTQRALGDPTRVLEPLSQRLDERSERLLLGWRNYLDYRRARLGEACSRLRHPRDLLALASQSLNEHGKRLQLGIRSTLEKRTARLNETSSRLRHPGDQLALAFQRLQSAQQKMTFAWSAFFTRKGHLLETRSMLLENLSPRAVLGRGYALVQDAKGHVVTSAQQSKPGDKLRIEFNDGTTPVVVEKP